MKLDRFRESSENPLFSLTAMIDVLFLMIIFLVLGANFDPVLSVDLPEAVGGAVKDTVVRVEIRVDGRLILDGRVLPSNEELEILRSRSPRSILLLPDRRLEVDKLFRWFDSLRRKLGIQVSVGVLPPPEE